MYDIMAFPTRDHGLSPFALVRFWHRLFCVDAVLKTLLGFAIMILTFAFPTLGIQPTALLMLGMVVVLDTVTGVAAAIVSGTPIRSARFVRVLTKSLAYASVIVMFGGLRYAVPGSSDVASAAVSAVLGFAYLTEAISICENARALGWALPPVIEEWLRGRMPPPIQPPKLP